MKNNVHSIITLTSVLFSFFLGWHTEVALAMAAFWVGREHAQAEYRWLALHKANRSRMPWYAGFFPESWNRDALINDLLAPVISGILVAYALQ